MIMQKKHKTSANIQNHVYVALRLNLVFGAKDL